MIYKFFRFQSGTFVLVKIKALAKLANIVWQTLLFISQSLAMDKKVTPDLRRKHQCLASIVGQFRQALKTPYFKL